MDKGHAAHHDGGRPGVGSAGRLSNQGLPISIQIVARNHHEFACLQLAYAYELATNWTSTRLPSLIERT
jgi:amidase